MAIQIVTTSVRDFDLAGAARSRHMSWLAKSHLMLLTISPNPTQPFLR